MNQSRNIIPILYVKYTMSLSSSLGPLWWVTMCSSVTISLNYFFRVPMVTFLFPLSFWSCASCSDTSSSFYDTSVAMQARTSNQTCAWNKTSKEIRGSIFFIAKPAQDPSMLGQCLAQKFKLLSGNNQFSYKFKFIF